MRLVVGHHVPGCGQAVAGKSMRFGACICYVPRRGFAVHRDDGAAVVLESTAVKKHVFFSGRVAIRALGLDEENWVGGWGVSDRRYPDRGVSRQIGVEGARALVGCPELSRRRWRSERPRRDLALAQSAVRRTHKRSDRAAPLLLDREIHLRAGAVNVSAQTKPRYYSRK